MKHIWLLFMFVLFTGIVIFSCSNPDNSGNSSSSSFISSSSEDSMQSDESSSSESSITSDESSSSEDSMSSDESSSSEDSMSSGESSSSDNPLSSSNSSSSMNFSSSSLRSSSSSSSSRQSSSSSEIIPSSSSLDLLVPVKYEKLTSSNAQRGWASRYWDGCKPHCSWRTNVDTTAVPFTVCRNCDKNNNEIAAFTLALNINEWWKGYDGTKNSCDGGIAYTCFDMAPIAINDTLSYGFAAAPGSNAACGQCFQLQFDGGNKNNDIKDAHRRISGKTLIVMASNIGHDVEAGQFDILIPGGGVGAYDSFSNLLGVNKEELGVTFGGFLSTCQQTLNDWDLPAARYKECVKEKCQAIFGRDPKFADLLRGCNWFADWYETADNPTYLYKKVDCPAYLVEKYVSKINTSKDTDLPYMQ